jgi:LPS-assembly lipoprotein
MTTRWYPLFFSLFFSFMLSACGFQLRGYGDFALPFHTISLEASQPYSNFTKELQRTLESMGVHPTRATPTSIRLQILAQNFSSTTTSLGNAGQTTTYLLAYTVLFKVIDCKGHVLLAPQQIRATRTFSITSNQLAGDLNTQNDLQENMQRDAIQQLLIRLGSPELQQQLRCSTCTQQ